MATVFTHSNNSGHLFSEFKNAQMHLLAEQTLKNKWEIMKELYLKWCKSQLFGFISSYYTILT